jgi:hypothetical protein
LTEKSPALGFHKLPPSALNVPEEEFVTELDEPYAVKTFGSSDEPEISLSEQPSATSDKTPAQAI